MDAIPDPKVETWGAHVCAKRRRKTSVVTAPSRTPRLLPVFVIAFRLGALMHSRRFLFRREAAFLAAAQLAVRHQAFEQKLRRCHHLRRGIGLLDAECGEIVEQTLNLLESGELGGRGLRVIEFHRSAQVEPLLDLLRVYAFEVAIVDLSYCR